MCLTGVVEYRHVAGRGQPSEIHREDYDQHDGEPERWDRNPGCDERGYDVVYPGPSEDGREDTAYKSNGEAHHQGNRCKLY